MEDHTFALCLSHDVDRAYKTYQFLYNSIVDLDPIQAFGMLSAENPWWQFETIMEIESSHEVRSSFNILDEQRLSERPLSERVTKKGIQLYAGRYDVTDPKIASTLRLLEQQGWEISLQGSYNSSTNPERFEIEKTRIEQTVNETLRGNRQHHWRLSRPDTWRYLRDSGIKYDTSLGSSDEIEFQHGYDLLRPFNDEFVVFPWTLMDGAVMGSAETFEGCWERCVDILKDTKENNGVIVADWHQRVFYESEFPGWGEIYDRLIEKAIEMGAWVGSPGEFYGALSHPDGTTEDALETLTKQD